MIQQCREDAITRVELRGDEELSPQPRHFRTALRLHLETTRTLLIICCKVKGFISGSMKYLNMGRISQEHVVNLMRCEEATLHEYLKHLPIE